MTECINSKSNVQNGLEIHDYIVGDKVVSTNCLFGYEGDESELLIPNFVEVIMEQACQHSSVINKLIP